jgi:NAD(P)-dependent dehydrogenase (short-subunit alcohol dehydrogenase family)
MRDVAGQANELGRFDAVIHNVGIGYREPRVETADGLSQLWAVNVLAPYVLTALIQRPQKPGRLVYLSSGMHLGGDPSLDDLQMYTVFGIFCSVVAHSMSLIYGSLVLRIFSQDSPFFLW